MPSIHLHGQGCIDCAGKRQYTNESFINLSNKRHHDKYDYSKVEYVNNKTPVCIICPEHGEFWQRPDSHLQGQGCPKCGGTTRLTTEEFIKKACEIHGDRYDYSKVEYINTETKVCIICPEHGEFWQTPHAHLYGQGCPKCYGNIKLTKEDFIGKSKHIHGDKYDYSKVEYNGFDSKVCIICLKHGEFWQTPHMHLQGQGCPKCYGLNKTNDDIISEFITIHGDKYDYSKVEYINTETKVCIICPEHGEFWQTPHNHLQGQGCPKCRNSKLHNKIRTLLKSNNIYFEEEKTFNWLRYKGNLYLDFYLPDYNIAIEVQGIQHFKSIEYFGGENGFRIRQFLDNLKYNLCTKNGIKIIYYADTDKYYYFNPIIYEDVKLLKEITNECN